MKLKCLLIIFCVLTALHLQAQDTTDYHAQIYESNGFRLPYRILYPQDFDEHKKYPVIFFLHGSGERGNDNIAQLAHGGDLFAKARDEGNLQAIVIFPQCDSSSFWSNVKFKMGNTDLRDFDFQKGGKPTESMRLLLGLIHEFEHKSFADKKKFALAGLSMGGMGTLELLRRKPGLFKNAISMCGGDNVKNVKRYARRTKLWIIYGAKDNVVAPHNSVDVYNEMKRLGADVHLSVYANDGHNCWDSAFKEKDFIPFLLK